MAWYWLWMIWAFMLVAQSASTTWASRARNSSSVGYHALASCFSNGVWFLNFYVGVNLINRTDTVGKLLATALFYITWTVTGAALMHWVSMRYLERGRRRVGARKSGQSRLSRSNSRSRNSAKSRPHTCSSGSGCRVTAHTSTLCATASSC